MTKGNLISFLHSYSDAYWDCKYFSRHIEELSNQIKTLKRKPPKPNSDSISNKKVIQFVALGIFMIVVWAVFFFCVQVMNPMDISDSIKIVVTLAISLVLPGILVLVVYNIYMHTLLDRKYKLILKQHINLRSELPTLENQLLQDRQLLKDKIEKLKQYESQGILPEKYCTGGYASIFSSYLEEGRADTLKEAINLWHLEEYQFAMYKEQERHNQEMESHQKKQTELAAAALDEAERATESQEATREDVNFWGLMNYLKKND